MQHQPPEEVQVEIEWARFFLAVCEVMKDQLVHPLLGGIARREWTEVECRSLLNISFSEFLAQCEDLREQIEACPSSKN